MTIFLVTFLLFFLIYGITLDPTTTCRSLSDLKWSHIFPKLLIKFFQNLLINISEIFLVKFTWKFSKKKSTHIWAKMLKILSKKFVLHTKYYNFFVFQYFFTKISVRSELIVKHSNPGFFHETCTQKGHKVPIIEKKSTKMCDHP